MNIALWILQGLLALHTLMGALWKLSNSEQVVPSLSALPHGVWLALGAVEVLCAVGLVLPAIVKRARAAAPLGAAGVGAEMLLFVAVSAASGRANAGEIGYWLVVAVLAGLVVFGRGVKRSEATAAIAGS